jgi:hypothetical protein
MDGHIDKYSSTLTLMLITERVGTTFAALPPKPLVDAGVMFVKKSCPVRLEVQLHL